MPKGWGLAMLSVGGMLLLLLMLSLSLSVAIVFVGFMISLVNCQSKMDAYALCNCHLGSGKCQKCYVCW